MNKSYLNYLYLKLFYFNLRFAELKIKIENKTNIERNSQLIIYNNLLLESLVTEQQEIESYPTIDKDHPLVLFSLHNTLTCDNNNIIKSSIFFIHCVMILFNDLLIL